MGCTSGRARDAWAPAVARVRPESATSGPAVAAPRPLYRVEKPEHRIDTRAPRRLVVLGAFRLDVDEVLTQDPSLRDQRVPEGAGIADHLGAFLGSRIQPDPEGELSRQRLDLAHDDLPVPPHGGGKRGKPAENAGVANAEMHREQPAKGRSAEA